MGTLEFILAIVTLATSGGWFITYRAYKRKNEAEATQAEADGWKAQQDVYQQTIKDLEESCEYIRNDRNLLREENKQLHEENNLLRVKYNELEEQIIDLRKELARQGRKLEALLPFTCGVAGCTNRTRVDVQEQISEGGIRYAGIKKR